MVDFELGEELYELSQKYLAEDDIKISEIVVGEVYDFEGNQLL